MTNFTIPYGGSLETDVLTLQRSVVNSTLMNRMHEAAEMRWHKISREQILHTVYFDFI